MKIKITTLLCLFMLSACGKPIATPNGTENLNPNSLEKARRSYCGLNSTKTLKEDPSAMNTYFENLDQRSRVFAFSDPSQGDCLFNKDVSISIGNGAAFFLLALRGVTCFPNNSVWEVYSSTIDNTSKRYLLRMFNDENFYVDMSATRGVHGNVARDNAHLRVLTCQD